MKKKKAKSTRESSSDKPSQAGRRSIYVFTDSTFALPPDVFLLTNEVMATATSARRLKLEAGLSPQSNSLQPPAELDSLLADLNRWDIQVHKYKDETEATAGFLGFGGVEARLLKAGLVQEAKRYLVRNTEEGRHVEFGVSVRLWVAVTEYGFSVDLTVPNLAASAQISKTNAKIGISVSGFSGALGQLLPSPESLNVTNFSRYLEAFREIQSHVFSSENDGKLSPVLLGFHEDNIE